MVTGTDKAWDLIERKGPDGIRRTASVRYEVRDGCYYLVSLGMEFRLCPSERSIRGLGAQAEVLYGEHEIYFKHSALWYLAESRGAGRTGRLIKPSGIKGGHHFFTRGTHVLPLDELAELYGSDAGAFVRRAGELGGSEMELGDVSVELMPLPQVPVVIALWLKDDEFPARADLFFDSSAEYQAPLDALWAASMLAVKAMM